MRKVNGFTAVNLSRSLAEQYARQLAQLANLIPQVAYTEDAILAESKGDRELLGKWKHSVLLLDEDEPVGMIMAYERKAEGTPQYPDNTLYISELAIKKDLQGKGLGRELLATFFEVNNSAGFKHLKGPFNYSVQTNGAEWNKSVQDLYKSFGFIVRTNKVYDNRRDLVLGWTPKPA